MLKIFQTKMRMMNITKQSSRASSLLQVNHESCMLPRMRFRTWRIALRIFVTPSQSLLPTIFPALTYSICWLMSYICSPKHAVSHHRTSSQKVSTTPYASTARPSNSCLLTILPEPYTSLGLPSHSAHGFFERTARGIWMSASCYTGGRWPCDQQVI